MSRGMGMGAPPPGSSFTGPSSPSPVSKEEELHALKGQSEALKAQMDAIMQRIDKLENE